MKLLHTFLGKLSATLKTIEWEHKLGWAVASKTPVIVWLGDLNYRGLIISKTNFLKGTVVFLSMETSCGTRGIVHKLNGSRGDRDSGQGVTLLFDKLKAHGISYHWDKNKQQRVWLDADQVETKWQEPDDLFARLGSIEYQGQKHCK